MAKLEGDAGSADRATGAGAAPGGGAADGHDAVPGVSGWGRHRFRFGELWERRRARHRSRGGSPLLRLGLLLVAGLLLLAWLVLNFSGR
jgi:hypothetical protein